jgi:phosphoribosyl 1,2-cyclic phosphodiesterase
MLRCELHHAVLQPGTPQDLGGGTLLRSVPVFHPGGGVALRIDRGGRGFVYAPDFDFDDGPCDAALAGLLSGAALAFLDCTYTPDDYDLHRGYGHAHWRHCAEIANAAGLPRWGLFHHAQSRSDAEIAEIEARVQALSPGAFAVREGETHAL